MFGWLRRGSKKKDLSDGLDQVAAFVRHLGYDITPAGAGAALGGLESGYRPFEVASHIAHVTLAQDIKKAGENIELLMALSIHGAGIIEALGSAKDAGLVHPAQWQNDSNAVLVMSQPGPNQMQMVSNVLSDPVIGDLIVAVSRIEYDSMLEDDDA